MTNRQIAFAKAPEGMPSAETFAAREVPCGRPGEGEILCRNIMLSVDPYLRLKMYDRRSYTPPLKAGELIPGRTVAQVVESRSGRFHEGDIVVIAGGWQDYAVMRDGDARKVDPGLAPLGAWLGPLGMTGLTAYAGLLDIGKPQPDEQLVVSGAGGAVGSLVGQIGKLKGCRVVGIAGSDEKCRSVVETFGFDACVNYRDPDFADGLAAACPDGCDIYFDNVGGRISLTVIPHLNDFARVIICGLISQYNGQQPAAPDTFDELTRLILTRRLTVRGFIVSDLTELAHDFERDMAGWLGAGKIAFREHIHDGFDQIVPAFLGMLAGANTGKTLVRIAQPDEYGVRP